MNASPNEQGREPRWTVEVPGTDATTSAWWQGDEANPEAPVLVMAHGAGSGMEHRTMDALAGAALAAGLQVVRFNFLYRARGRGGPDRMPLLRACFAAVVDSVRRRLQPARLLIGGQSMGGRCASMMAAGADGDDGAFACDGVVLFAYPLHPAGRTDRLRAEHLPRIAAPVLCFCGTRDALCQQDLMAGVAAGLPATFTLHWLEGADHGYKVLQRSGRTQDEVFAEIAAALQHWATEPPTSTR